MGSRRWHSPDGAAYILKLGGLGLYIEFGETREKLEDKAPWLRVMMEVHGLKKAEVEIEWRKGAWLLVR